ncbi:thioredoxin family protein [Terribacillus sp. DMT04]|uniref:thioredoxin family protein n=1 Tax=Terribacillus sp. DMT04 TaxID=2850441 RepID=UPI001C2C9A57|nr:thioredoxin family protein [Terribacillus sp. DMT04]QXE02910.1 thioredoxin family protein [Terribacillus sp. DMT04]
MQLHSMETTERFINENQLAVLFISSPGCSVCEALLPRIRELAASQPDVQLGYTDASEVPEVVGRFMAFGAPTIVVFAEGKEQFREGRFVRLEDFAAKLEKISSLMKKQK